MLKKRKVEPTVHDRRSTDLLANALAVPTVVDDPMERGAKIAVMRSIRDDKLAAMRSRDEIDEAQFLAGRKYEMIYEWCEVGNVQAINPTKEAVDGGGWGDVLSNRQINATRDLSDIRAHIGADADELMHRILIRRMTFGSLGLSERKTAELRRGFFHILEQMAHYWGYVGGRGTRG